MQNSWQSSDDLTNFFINKKNLNKSLITDTYDINSDICCFSHIPKTAGTSIESILAKNFTPSEVLHINAPDLNLLPSIINAKKSLPRFICGHHPLHGLLYQLIQGKPLFHFTMLRNPTDRVLSYFNYVKGKKDHAMYQYTIKNSLEDFLMAEPSPELSNGQARRFSGYLHSGHSSIDTLFTHAKDVLTHCFSLVLTTCLFDQGLLLLKKRLDLKDVFYLRKNESTQFVHKDDLSDTTLNLIMENNRADIELFDWAKAQCETLIQNELTSKAIAQFKANNHQWRLLMSL